MTKKQWAGYVNKLLAKAPREKRRILHGMAMAIYDEAMAGGKPGKAKRRLK